MRRFDGAMESGFPPGDGESRFAGRDQFAGDGEGASFFVFEWRAFAAAAIFARVAALTFRFLRWGFAAFAVGWAFSPVRASSCCLSFSILRRIFAALASVEGVRFNKEVSLIIRNSVRIWVLGKERESWEVGLCLFWASVREYEWGGVCFLGKGTAG